MRVLVATDGIGGLDSLAAGQALAAGWAEAGHQVAVVPLAAGGPSLERAVAALAGGRPGPAGFWVASAAGLAGRFADLPAAGRIVVDLTTDPAPGAGPTDAGEALLAALPGSPVSRHEPLAGLDLVGVVRRDETARTLLGLRGAVAEKAFADGLETAARLAAEATAAAWLARHGLTDQPGAGAAGGAGAVILALGGRLSGGTVLCAELAGLHRTLAAADLVVTGCTDFHIGNRGGEVVGFVADAAESLLVPCVVFAEVSEVGRREMRTFGVEAAHTVDPGPPQEALRATAVRIARGWSGTAGGA